MNVLLVWHQLVIGTRLLVRPATVTKTLSTGWNGGNIVKHNHSQKSLFTLVQLAVFSGWEWTT